MKTVTCTVTSAFVLEGTIVAPGPKGKPQKIDLAENLAKGLAKRGKVTIGSVAPEPEEPEPAATKPAPQKQAAKKTTAKPATAKTTQAGGKDGDGGS